MAVSGGVPELTPEDLAGLSPQDVSRAFAGALNYEELLQRQKEFEEEGVDRLINRIYKTSLINRELASKGAEPIFVKNVPGYGDLTLDQYKGLPSSDREYVSHVLAAREIGEKPLTREEFDKLGTDEKERIPTTAMGAAIARYYEENKKLPPDDQLQAWANLFRAPSEEKTPSPMTWNSALNQLDKNYGYYDPVGRYVTTPEAKAERGKAQEYMNLSREQGIHPMTAIIQAKEKARIWRSQIEAKYFEYIEKAQKITDDDKRVKYIQDVNDKFYSTYGYIPAAQR